MSKYDYLHALYQALVSLDVTTRNTIMRTVEDRFRHAEEKGINEIDITNELGTPIEYATSFIQQMQNDTVNDTKDIISNEANIDIIPNIELVTVGDVDLQIVHSIDSMGLLHPQKVTTISSDSEKQNQIHFKKTLEENKNLVNLVKPSPTKDSSRIISSSHNALEKKSHSPLVLILTALGLVIFNITIILGPFIGLWSVIFAFVTAGIALAFSGLLIVLSGAFSFPLSFISVPLIVVGHPVLLFALGFLIIGIGGLLTIFMIYCISFFGSLTSKYVNWNLKVIRGY